jgi:preprotein translocase subunit SecE
MSDAARRRRRGLRAPVRTLIVSTGAIDNSREHVTGWFTNSKTFLSEVRNELKRVTWPTRKEVYATTLVVILTSIFFGVYLFALDFGMNSAVQWIFKRFGAA